MSFRSGQRFFQLSFLLLAAVLLASCASPPAIPPASRDLNQLVNWQLEGKLGFRSPQKNGSAWINWQQNADSYRLQLTGPFGAGATRITGDQYRAVLSQAGEEDLVASSGEELTALLFGWPLAVTEMAFWAKGVPAPIPVAASARGDQHQLTSLEQLGWKLEYSDYRITDGWLLPGRIKGRQGETSFTLVIKSWSPLPP